MPGLCLGMAPCPVACSACFGGSGARRRSSHVSAAPLAAVFRVVLPLADVCLCSLTCVGVFVCVLGLSNGRDRQHRMLHGTSQERLDPVAELPVEAEAADTDTSGAGDDWGWIPSADAKLQQPAALTAAKRRAPDDDRRIHTLAAASAAAPATATVAAETETGDEWGWLPSVTAQQQESPAAQWPVVESKEADAANDWDWVPPAGASLSSPSEPEASPAPTPAPTLSTPPPTATTTGDAAHAPKTPADDEWGWLPTAGTSLSSLNERSPSPLVNPGTNQSADTDSAPFDRSGSGTAADAWGWVPTSGTALNDTAQPLPSSPAGRLRLSPGEPPASDGSSGADWGWLPDAGAAAPPLPSPHAAQHASASASASASDDSAQTSDDEERGHEDDADDWDWLPTVAGADASPPLPSDSPHRRLHSPLSAGMSTAAVPHAVAPTPAMPQSVAAAPSLSMQEWMPPAADARERSAMEPAAPPQQPLRSTKPVRPSLSSSAASPSKSPSFPSSTESSADNDDGFDDSEFVTGGGSIA